MSQESSAATSPHVDVDLDRWLTRLEERELLPKDVVCVFVSGSVIRGWGNATSDLDFYVISPSTWSGEYVETVDVGLGDGLISANAFYEGEQRWDVEYWTTGQCEELFNWISWQTYDSDQVDSRKLTGHAIDFLERLPYGRALVGEQWLRERREEVDRSALRTVLINERLHTSDILVEDAVGQLISRDFESAVLSARLAFGYAVDALTAAYGEYSRAWKWRARRLHAIEQEVIDFDDYWQMETMRHFDPANPGKWVESVVETCRHIATRIDIEPGK